MFLLLEMSQDQQESDASITVIAVAESRHCMTHNLGRLWRFE
jgi:hypothetical protein